LGTDHQITGWTANGDQSRFKSLNVQTFLPEQREGISLNSRLINDDVRDQRTLALYANPSYLGTGMVRLALTWQ